MYEYLCAKCGKLFEKIEKFSARRTQKCPHCGGKAERQLSASGFQLKGSGWYVTDYARGAGAGTKKEEGAASDAKDAKETKEVKEVKETKETKKDTKKEKKQK